MPVEVPCPQCGSILRAPQGSAGKKARCKKCQHGFRLPGVAVEDIGQESTQLSVVDQPAFTFDAPAAEVERPSKSKYNSSTSSPSGKKPKGKPHRGEPGKSGLMLTLLGVAVVLIAGGVGIYFYTNQPKPVDTAAASSTPLTPKEKPAEPARDKEPAKKNDVRKTPPTTAPKAEAPGKGSEKKSLKTQVTGGLKLPPPPTKADTYTKPLAKASVDTEYAKIRKMFVSGGDTPVAAIVWVSDAGFQGQGAKDTVDRYSMASGERIDRTEIALDGAPWPRACDLSPGGDHFITEGPAGTLTLYDLNAKAKEGTPFKPFAGNPEVPTAPVAAALFVDEKTVLVAAKDGQLERWDAKEGKKIGAGSVGAVTLSAKSCEMKQDRSAMLVVAGATLQEVPAVTMTPKVVLNLPHGGGEGLAIAVDGADRVVVAYRAAQPAPHTRFLVARLGEEKTSVDQHVDEAAGLADSVAWSGVESFTLGFEKGAALLFDTEVNRPVATLWPQGGAGRHVLAGHKHYVLMADSGDAKKSLIVSVDFPPGDYLPLKNEAVAEKKPLGFLVGPEGLGR